MAIKPLPADQSAFTGPDGKPSAVFYIWLKSIFDTLSGLLALFPGGSTSSTAWTSYTPAVTPETGAITSSTATGASYQFGKIVFVRFTVTIINAGTGSGDLVVTLPVTEAADQFIGGLDSANGGQVTGIITGGIAALTYSDASTLIITGVQVVCSGTYEAA